MKRTKKDPDQKLVTKSTVRKRGWTEKMCDTYLPKPACTLANPHYRSGPPMSLYDLESIEATEKTDSFQLAREKSKPRQASAQKAVQTKLDAVKQYVEKAKFPIHRTDRYSLIRCACENYNAHHESEYGDAHEHSDPLFLDRICVNYLRHQACQYEQKLEGIFGKVGASEAYLQIKFKVLDSIARAYDYLADECGRQKERAESIHLVFLENKV